MGKVTVAARACACASAIVNETSSVALALLDRLWNQGMMQTPGIGMPLCTADAAPQQCPGDSPQAVTEEKEAKEGRAEAISEVAKRTERLEVAAVRPDCALKAPTRMEATGRIIKRPWSGSGPLHAK